MQILTVNITFLLVLQYRIEKFNKKGRVRRDL